MSCRLVLVSAFGIVVTACGGKVAPAPEPAASVTPAPGAPVDGAGGAAAAPGTSTPEEAPGPGPFRTDLEDEGARAICLEREGRPRGSLTADPVLGLGWVTDVTISESEESFSLGLDGAPEKAVDPVHGAMRTVSGSHYAVSGATTVGRHAGAVLGISGWKTRCFADGHADGISGTSPGDPIPALIEIAARTASFIDGSLEMTSAAGTPRRLTFHARLIEPAASAEGDPICCLR
jgi:hypothetical protein